MQMPSLKIVICCIFVKKTFTHVCMYRTGDSFEVTFNDFSTHNIT